MWPQNCRDHAGRRLHVFLSMSPVLCGVEACGRRLLRILFLWQCSLPTDPAGYGIRCKSGVLPMKRESSEGSQKALGWLALFASTGTLLCCALPILLVSIGMGAVVASLTSQFPVLVALASYESWMFGGSALILGIAAWVLWKSPVSCPADPILAGRCKRAQTWNRSIFFLALAVWSVGFTAAFLLLPLRNLLGV